MPGPTKPSDDTCGLKPGPAPGELLRFPEGRGGRQARGPGACLSLGGSNSPGPSSAQASGRGPHPATQRLAPWASCFTPPLMAAACVTPSFWRVLNFSFLFYRVGPTGPALAGVRGRSVQHIVVLNRVPTTVTVTVIRQGPQSHDKRSGGWAEPLQLEAPHVHSVCTPTPSRLRRTGGIPPHLGPSCPQSQSESHTEAHQINYCWLGEYIFLRRHFSRGRNTQEL